MRYNGGNSCLPSKKKEEVTKSNRIYTTLQNDNDADAINLNVE